MLVTDKDSLSQLKKLNKLALTAAQDEDTLTFFAAKNAELEKMAALDTECVEAMIRVMPISAVLREDKATAHFTRDELQASAPDVRGGYLKVPRLLE